MKNPIVCLLLLFVSTINHYCLAAKPTNVIVRIGQDYRNLFAYKFLTKLVPEERFKITLIEVGREERPSRPIQTAETTGQEEDDYLLRAINWNANANYELSIELAKCGPLRYRQTIIRRVPKNENGQYGAMIAVSIWPTSNFGALSGIDVESPSDMDEYERALGMIGTECQRRQDALALECEWATLYAKIAAKEWIEEEKWKGWEITEKEKEFWRRANEDIAAFYRRHFQAQEQILLEWSTPSSTLALPQPHHEERQHHNFALPTQIRPRHINKPLLLTMPKQRVEKGGRGNIVGKSKERKRKYSQNISEKGQQKHQQGKAKEKQQNMVGDATMADSEQQFLARGQFSREFEESAGHPRHHQLDQIYRHSGGPSMRTDGSKKRARSQKNVDQGEERKTDKPIPFTNAQIAEMEKLRQLYRANPDWKKKGYNKKRNDAYEEAKNATKLHTYQIYYWMKKRDKEEKRMMVEGEGGREEEGAMDDWDDEGYSDNGLPTSEQNNGDDDMLLDYDTLQGHIPGAANPHNGPHWHSYLVSDSDDEQQHSTKDGTHHHQQASSLPPRLLMGGQSHKPATSR